MSRNNLIFLGIGVLVAYLIFKPKGAKASTTPQPPIDCEKEWDKYWEKNFAHVKMTKEGVEGEKRNFMAKCRGTLTPTPAPSPNPIPTPLVKFVEGKQYTLTLERDYQGFKKGTKITGIYRIIPSGVPMPILEFSQKFAINESTSGIKIIQIPAYQFVEFNRE